MKQLILTLTLLYNITFAQDVINLCNEDRIVTYYVIGFDNSTFAWSVSNGSITDLTFNSATILWPDSTGNYTISVIEITENNCVGDEIKLNVFVESCLFYYIPNTFTVNQDGKNEIFNIAGYSLDKLTNFKMLIFNRWGELIYETNNINSGWNGYFNGRICPIGVYTYKIEFKKDAEYFLEIGQVNLLR